MPFDRSRGLGTSLAFVVLLAAGRGAMAQEPAPEAPAEPDLEALIAKYDLPSPKPIPEFELPALPTIPVRHGSFNRFWTTADTVVLPKDDDGIWILEFSFLPVRVIEYDVPGKGRKRLHYLYYRVVNRTGEPRPFVPQFTLVTDDGQRSDDTVLPGAVDTIQAKIDPSRNLLGAVESTGTIPPSTKEGVDDAVFGVAIWDDVDPAADAFSVYVRGLSDGNVAVGDSPSSDASAAEGTDSEPAPVRYKALRIDFSRPGDERVIHSREIRLKSPAYEWVYYP